MLKCVNTVFYIIFFKKLGKSHTSPIGFEPMRGDPNGFLVHRLNHSATTTGYEFNSIIIIILLFYKYTSTDFYSGCYQKKYSSHQNYKTSYKCRSRNKFRYYCQTSDTHYHDPSKSVFRFELSVILVTITCTCQERLCSFDIKQ